MSKKDFDNLMELAQKQAQEKVSKEEALRSLVRAGLLDKDGNLIIPSAGPAISSRLP